MLTDEELDLIERAWNEDMECPTPDTVPALVADIRALRAHNAELLAEVERLRETPRITNDRLQRDVERLRRRHSLAEQLELIYSAERNVELSCFWDRGWVLHLGDPTNGFDGDEQYFKNLQDVADWLAGGPAAEMEIGDGLV